MARYGMVIDLKRCYGCYSCVMGCKQANCTPPGVFWSRVLRGEMGVFPNSVRQALPVLCNQCEEPDCMKVCPTGATYQTDDGIVRVDKNKCIGCKYCMMACPYGARYSVPEYKSYFPEGLPLSDYEKRCMQVWEEKERLRRGDEMRFLHRQARRGKRTCLRPSLSGQSTGFRRSRRS